MFGQRIYGRSYTQIYVFLSYFSHALCHPGADGPFSPASRRALFPPPSVIRLKNAIFVYDRAWEMRLSEKELRDNLAVMRDEAAGVDAVAAIATLVSFVRPYTHLNAASARDRLQRLTAILKEDRAAARTIRSMVWSVFMRSDISEAMAGSGINSEGNFFRELSKRLRHKILPPLDHSGSLQASIGEIFPHRTDYRWVEQIPDEHWAELFAILGFRARIADRSMLLQLYGALYAVSNRAGSLSLETEIDRCLTREERQCFVMQGRTVLDIQSAFEEGCREKCREAESRLMRLLDDCEATVARIHTHARHHGTSLHQSYVISRLGQMIARMKMILLMAEGDFSGDLRGRVRHFKSLVHDRNTRNSVRQLLRDNVELLALRIAEHERNTGEHYITATPAEYNSMLRSAMGGGVIISFVALLKALMHFIRMAPFWQGIAYSVNYAAGFIGIYATGSTLATKQPAMTASAIASSLDHKNNRDKPNMPELAILLSEVSRSQLASFAGNLAVVFPLTLLMAWGWETLAGFPIAEGAFARQLLDNQNPLRTPSLLYACFTGVFLFLSGIISGYFDNLAAYGNIPERLRRHPWLRRTVSPARLDGIASYAGKHLGGIMGNLCLGFFLGMAGFVGQTLGVSFDIRHITISTANFAIGLQGLDFDVPTADLVWTTAGVLLIGFLNFLVSFALAFMTAMASRRVRFGQYRRLMLYLARLAVRYPLDFVRPPRTLRKPSDFMQRKI